MSKKVFEGNDTDNERKTEIPLKKNREVDLTAGRQIPAERTAANQTDPAHEPKNEIPKSKKNTPYDCNVSRRLARAGRKKYYPGFRAGVEILSGLAKRILAKPLGDVALLGVFLLTGVLFLGGDWTG